jgi:hypothetical protein
MTPTSDRNAFALAKLPPMTPCFEDRVDLSLFSFFVFFILRFCGEAKGDEQSTQTPAFSLSLMFLSFFVVAFGF